MQHVDIDDVEPGTMGDADRRGLSEALGTSGLAVNYYALDPGEVFSGGLHTHLDQEEVFFVVEGTATFEHREEATAEGDTVAVGPGEAVRFAPGEFQQGRNEGDDRVVALALGAPRETSEGRVAQPCPECDSDVLAVRTSDDGMTLECPDCGATLDP
jgi:mannose-6-phosphate isomerase-like protein (cupin superfamily)